MPLTMKSYEARCHLCYVRPLGQAHSFIIIGFVEERAPVRIGIRDIIVAIEVQRARIVTIVGIAQQFSTTETAFRSSTYFIESNAKLHFFCHSNKSKSDFRLFLFLCFLHVCLPGNRPPYGRRRFAPVCFALRASSDGLSFPCPTLVPSRTPLPIRRGTRPRTHWQPRQHSCQRGTTSPHCHHRWHSPAI